MIPQRHLPGIACGNGMIKIGQEFFFSFFAYKQLWKEDAFVNFLVQQIFFFWTHLVGPLNG